MGSEGASTIMELADQRGRGELMDYVSSAPVFSNHENAGRKFSPSSVLQKSSTQLRATYYCVTRRNS
jgi:hypothetical protein